MRKTKGRRTGARWIGVKMVKRLKKSSDGRLEGGKGDM